LDHELRLTLGQLAGLLWDLYKNEMVRHEKGFDLFTGLRMSQMKLLKRREVINTETRGKYGCFESAQSK